MPSSTNPMNDYIHYILVRRDLPFGTTLAQVAHAAANTGQGQITVAVLGVRDEPTLKRWADKLTKHNAAHAVIKEPDPPYNGAWTAIGVFPSLRSRLSPIFRKLTTYTEPGVK